MGLGRKEVKKIGDILYMNNHLFKGKRG